MLLVTASIQENIRESYYKNVYSIFFIIENNIIVYYYKVLLYILDYIIVIHYHNIFFICLKKLSKVLINGNMLLSQLLQQKRSKSKFKNKSLHY